MPDENATMMGVSGATPAPTASPMAPPAGTPSGQDVPAKGEIEQAKANVQMAITMLEQSLPILGSSSPEGQAVIKSVAGLSKTFGSSRSQDLVPQQLLQAMSSMPDSIKQQAGAEMNAGQPAAGA